MRWGRASPAGGRGPKLEPIRDAAGLARLSKRGGRDPGAGDGVAQRASGRRCPRRRRSSASPGRPGRLRPIWSRARAAATTRSSAAWPGRSKTVRRADGCAGQGDPALSDPQVEAGAEALQIFDTWAGAVPAGLFERAVSGPTARIVAAVKAKHPACAGDRLSRAGQAGILDLTRGRPGRQGSSRSHVRSRFRAAAVPGQGHLQGNLDPVLLLDGGAAMEAETRRILSAMKGRPFIFNLGHGVTHRRRPKTWRGWSKSSGRLMRLGSSSSISAAGYAGGGRAVSRQSVLRTRRSFARRASCAGRSPVSSRRGGGPMRSRSMLPSAAARPSCRRPRAQAAA